MTGFTQSNLIVQSYYLLLNEGIPTFGVGLVLPINSVVNLIFCVVARFRKPAKKDTTAGEGFRGKAISACANGGKLRATGVATVRLRLSRNAISYIQDDISPLQISP